MKLKLFTFAALLILGFTTCSKDEPNPCAGATPFKATFDILEEVGDTLIATDTAVANNRVFFKAPKGYDSYAWYVDDEKMDNFYIQKDPTQFFLGFMYPDKDIKITLVAKKKPQTACFPDDDGIDSVTKYLQVRDIWNTPIRGRYFGYYKSNPKDTTTVEIVIRIFNRTAQFGISNVYKGCNSNLEFNTFDKLEFSWRGLSFEGFSTFGNILTCYAPTGTIILAPNHQDLTIYCKWFPNFDYKNPKQDIFIGKRIK